MGMAYKLLLAGLMPRVSYQTVLDKYVMMCVMFVFIATTMHAVVPTVLQPMRPHTAEGGRFALLRTLRGRGRTPTSTGTILRNRWTLCPSGATHHSCASPTFSSRCGSMESGAGG